MQSETSIQSEGDKEAVESVHHDILYRLVDGAAGSTTEDLQVLYEAVAPAVYKGTLKAPVSRRWRRKLLEDLRDSGLVDSHDTPRGRIWAPVGSKEVLR